MFAERESRVVCDRCISPVQASRFRLGSEDEMFKLINSLLKSGYTLEEIDQMTSGPPPAAPPHAATSLPAAPSAAEEEPEVQFVKRMVIDSYPRSGEETPSFSAQNSGRGSKHPGKRTSSTSAKKKQEQEKKQEEEEQTEPEEPRRRLRSKRK
ncbi:hypothetical protein KCU93_g444, partial [Aureobasidium melanogenum]